MALLVLLMRRVWYIAGWLRTSCAKMWDKKMSETFNCMLDISLCHNYDKVSMYTYGRANYVAGTELQIKIDLPWRWSPTSVKKNALHSNLHIIGKK